MYLRKIWEEMILNLIAHPELTQGLIERFLYQRNDNCFFNVLEYYVMQGSLYRLQPSGIIEKNFKRLIDRFFKRMPRAYRLNIRRVLLQGLRTDFDRLETTYSFLGYHEGFEMNKRANNLELIMLKNCIIEDEDATLDLRQHLSLNKNVKAYRDRLKEEIFEDEYVNNLIRDYSRGFSEVFLNERINHLNRDMESQLTLSFDDFGYSIHEDNIFIPKERLELIMSRAENLFFRSGMNLYSKCAFLGLSDRVIRRYN